MQKERLAFIDVAKSLAMIAVVIGHTISPKNIISEWLYLWHLPMFFFTAGLCFNINKYQFLSLLKRRIKQLILPSIYFSILISICFLLLNIYSGEEWITSICNLLSNYKYGLPGVMWFIPILFISEILSFPIIRYIKYKIILISILVILCVIQYMFKGIKMPYDLNTVFVGMFFYLSGNLLRKNMLEPTFYIKSRNYLLILFILTYIYIIFSDGSMDIHGNYYHDITVFVFSLFAVLGVLLISNIRYISTSKILNYIGRNTLIILPAHLIIQKILWTFIHPYFIEWGHFAENVLYKFVYLFFACIFCYLSIEFINRKAKWMIGK